MGLIVDTNPLSGDYDQSVSAAIQPVFVIYHAPSINKVVEVFRPPESVRLHQYGLLTFFFFFPTVSLLLFV